MALDRGCAGDGAPVLILSPLQEHPAPAILARLEQEYELRADLDSAWAVTPRALMREAGKLLLILDDPGGELLESRLGRALDLSVALPLAISLAQALGQVHARGLIHKDLCPAHILTRENQVRLLGFGLASRLPKERQAPEPPEIIAGTLPYLAPEQTGRMNRSIDARSDLYAFGVILYRMLTGELPFMAADPMEWIHCHIARQPVPPAERVPGLPSALSAMVMKCLAKTAEERYQTTGGLTADLKRCLARWEATGVIEPFPLGAQDIPDQLRIPERLYGREGEVAALLAAFDRVVGQGPPELVLVSGYSGVGKSAVVNELHKALVPSRGLFAAGKFDQYKRDIPYATLAQAFQGLIRPLLGKREAELACWREELCVALAPNGLLMINLVPELQLIIGDQPPVAELPPQEAEYRFRRLVRRFVGVFARPEHPLALFLDDLQWLDSATLSLLADLATHPELKHLLLIGAYRDNEVDAAHPLRQSLNTIRQAGGAVHEIVLAPLAQDDVGRLVAETLHCKGEAAQPLARLVFEKTGGNPFFTIQFLTNLAEETLLAYDAGRGAWVWDLERIRAKGYTDNVVDLMVGKLARLPEETQEALKPFACLGNVANIAILGLVLGESPEAVHAVLWEAVRAGLVIRQDQAYAFLHDRVQEAAYSLIPETLRAATHLSIGRLLAASLTPEEISERIFDVVGQFNRGCDQVKSPTERERIAELNLMAGRRAKAATAYASALGFLTAGCELLAENGWQRSYELNFALELHRAECEYLTGRATTAEERLAMLARRAGSLIDAASVACVQVALYTTLARPDLGIDAVMDYLRRLGIEWSPHPTADDVRREYDSLWSRLGSRSIEDLIDLPTMTDPQWRATMELLNWAFSPARFTDNNLLCLIGARMANLSLEHGNSDASGLAYLCLGTVLGPRFGDYRTGFRFGKLGFDLLEKCDLLRFKAQTYFSFGVLINPWMRHVDTSIKLVRCAFEVAQESGNLAYASYSCFCLITLRLAEGVPLAEVQQEAEGFLSFAEKAGFGLVNDIIVGQLSFMRSLRELTPRFILLGGKEVDEAGFERHLEDDPQRAIAACTYWIRKLQTRFFAGDHPCAIGAAAKAQPLLWTLLSCFEAAEYHFYGALAVAADWDSVPADQRPQRLQALAAHHEQLSIWAENCPDNFKDRVALVAAEVARIEGRDLEAMRLYEEAIRAARDSGFIHNEALANELAGRFHLARDFETSALAYLRNARYAYLRWGAPGKAKALEATWPRLAEPEHTGSTADTIGAPVEQLDVATVVKASQAVSSDIVLDRLTETLMRIALEHAGADRGLLILSRAGSYRIEARAIMEQGKLQVILGGAPPTASDLPEAILHYVARAHETVLLDDTSAPHLFSEDPYLVGKAAKSILCLPLIKQGSLVGLLYLENNLAPRAFTRKHLAILELLASQAAISLENASLYAGLQEREARIRRLVEANIIGILFWNLKGEVIAANDALLEMVGYTRHDLDSRKVNWAGMTPPEYLVADERAIAEIKATGICRPFEKEYIRKDGSRVPVLIAAALFEGSQDEGVAFVLDLTERKRAEAEQQARQAAEAANRAKSEFLANMSHELRSPLNTILGFTRLLERDPTLPEAAREDLGLVLKSGEHLHALINDVLDLTKLDAGRATVNEADFDLDFLLDELKDMLTPAAIQKGLQLIFAPRHQVPHYVRSDPLKLRQILINLIGNAIKFTRQGSVTVRVQPKAASDRPGLLFSVADTGSGIAPDELGDLFASFAQARAGREAREGTGLGLAISRGLVRLMGGEMYLESEVGRGTTVSFDLPVQAAASQPIREEMAPRQVVGVAPGQPRYRILAVDDHAEARHLLVRLLVPLSFDVREAANGQEAIELWRQWQPDLIWMDMRMPVLDGRAATRRIRAEQAGKGPVITALTASSFEEERGDVLATGCDDMLRKPFCEAELFADLERHLGVRFVYQEAVPEPTVPPHPPAPAILPAPLRAQLEEAIAQLDPERINQAIEAIQGIDSQLAQALATSAREFQYDAILSLISEAAQETK